MVITVITDMGVMSLKTKMMLLENIPHSTLELVNAEQMVAVLVLCAVARYDVCVFSHRGANPGAVHPLAMLDT